MPITPIDPSQDSPIPDHEPHEPPIDAARIRTELRLLADEAKDEDLMAAHGAIVARAPGISVQEMAALALLALACRREYERDFETETIDMDDVPSVRELAGAYTEALLNVDIPF